MFNVLKLGLLRTLDIVATSPLFIVCSLFPFPPGRPDASLTPRPGSGVEAGGAPGGRLTRLQLLNWDLEERLKGAELQAQKLQEAVARKDEVLQHWCAPAAFAVSRRRGGSKWK